MGVLGKVTTINMADDMDGSIGTNHDGWEASFPIQFGDTKLKLCLGPKEQAKIAAFMAPYLEKFEELEGAEETPPEGETDKRFAGMSAKQVQWHKDGRTWTQGSTNGKPHMNADKRPRPGGSGPLGKVAFDAYAKVVPYPES